LSIDEARENLRRATKIILDLEGEYAKAVERAADAEAVYRAKLAESFKRFREAGEAVQAADTLARAEVATTSRERDFAAGMLKLAGEKLEDGRDSRRSLWRLIEWSREHERAVGGNGSDPMADERVPRGWP
jgi:hypothetical protein